MNKKRDRLKKKQQEQRREARRQARAVGEGGRIAPWKIALPVIVLLFMVHCRFWHAEEDWLMRTALADVGYQSLTGIIFTTLLALGICGWMLYAYSRPKKPDKESPLKQSGRNLLYGFFWGVGIGALCTNIMLVFLFWLNSCFTSEVKTCECEIVSTTLHNRESRSHTSRYSAAWLINRFSYREVFIKDDRYKRLYVPLQTVGQFGCMPGFRLKIELADGWLGWGVIRKIYPVSPPYPKPQEDVITDMAGNNTEQPTDSVAKPKKQYTFQYTWRDVRIFAKLRNINLKDTTHVSVNRYIDNANDAPVWELIVRDSLQLDKGRVILIHGETGEVLMDSYE